MKKYYINIKNPNLSDLNQTCKISILPRPFRLHLFDLAKIPVVIDNLSRGHYNRCYYWPIIIIEYASLMRHQWFGPKPLKNWSIQEISFKIYGFKVAASIVFVPLRAFKSYQNHWNRSKKTYWKIIITWFTSWLHD